MSEKQKSPTQALLELLAPNATDEQIQECIDNWSNLSWSPMRPSKIGSW